VSTKVPQFALIDNREKGCTLQHTGGTRGVLIAGVSFEDANLIQGCLTGSHSTDPASKARVKKLMADHGFAHGNMAAETL
jgi:hypothetical protein